MLARLPAEHRVLLASRRDLGLASLARGRIAGEVLDLRADDLRFATTRRCASCATGSGSRWTRATSPRSSRAPRAGRPRCTSPRCGCASATRSRRSWSSSGGEDLFGALTDEVLRSSPEHERRFILETAVLDRFNADLCARLLGDDATAAFRTLTRTSLLLSPLDRGRTWFRCHHLLRECCAPPARGRPGACARAAPSARGRGLRPRAARASCTRRCTTTSPRGVGPRGRAAGPPFDRASSSRARWAAARATGSRASRRRSCARTRGSCYVSALLAALDGDRARRDAWLAGGERAGWEGPMPDGTASLRLAGACLTAMLCFDDLGGAVGRGARGARGAARRLAGALGGAGAERVAPAAARRRRARRSCSRREALAGQVHLPSAGLPLVAYLPSRCSRSSRPSAATSTPPRAHAEGRRRARPGRCAARRTRCR